MINNRRSIVFRLLMIVLIPMLLVGFLGGLAIENSTRAAASKLAYDEFKADIYIIYSTITSVADGDFTYKDGNICKGDINLTEHSDILDELKRELGIDVTLYCGNIRVATTVVNAQTGAREVNTTMSDEIYQKLLREGAYFSTDANVQGVPYYGFYTKIQDRADGKDMFLFAGKPKRAIQDLYMINLVNQILFMAGVAVASIVVDTFLVVRIAKTLVKLVASLKDFAGGNLRQELDPKILVEKDEIGDIARAIDDLSKSMIKTVDDIRNGAVEIRLSSEELRNNFESFDNSIGAINTAIDDLSAGATSLADGTLEVSSHMDKMAGAVSKTNENINELIDNSNDMRKQNKEVEVTFNELIKVNNETCQFINNVQEQTNITNKSALEIQGAIDIISDIASQTNLLSLNASIEAARAGEQGKGFAVVAEEVRQLADQSQSSVEKIATIVNKLISNSNVSVEIMGEVSGRMEEQSRQLENTKEIFQKLNDNINEVGRAVESISAEMRSIDVAKDVVTKNLESVASVSQQNAASTQECAATTEQLKTTISECNNEVGRFVDMAGELEKNVAKFKL